MDWKRVTALTIAGIGLCAARAEALTLSGMDAAGTASPAVQDVYWSFQGGYRVWIPDAPAYYPPYYAPRPYYAAPPAYYAPPYAGGPLPYFYGGRYYAHRGWYGGGWRYW